MSFEYCKQCAMDVAVHCSFTSLDCVHIKATNRREMTSPVTFLVSQWGKGAGTRTDTLHRPTAAQLRPRDAGSPGAGHITQGHIVTSL